METYELSEELRKKLEEADSLEEVVSIFNEAGIPVTKEQLERMGSAENEDLDECDLDAVSGGLLLPLSVLFPSRGRGLVIDNIPKLLPIKFKFK